MDTHRLDDLREFHRFVGEKLDEAGDGLSPEDLLDQWRERHPVTTEDLEAIQEAIDDIENGDVGISFDDFDREFRARHNLAPRA